MSSTQKLNNSGKPLPDIGLKWGRTPKTAGDDDNGNNNNDKVEQASENIRKHENEDHDENSSAASLVTTTKTTTKEISNPTTTATSNANDTGTDWENFYSEEEKGKLRKKGINPALKAEMEHAKRNSEGKGFWGKLAGTAAGGGWIK